MSVIAIIFPHQLFELRYLPYDYHNMDHFLIVEDTLFFQDPERVLNFNLLKLIFQRASMKYYQDFLESQGCMVHYLNWESKPNFWMKYVRDTWGENNKLYIVNPMDRLLEQRLRIWAEKYKQEIVWHETPSFLCTEKDLNKYHKKNPNYFQYNFYIWQRKRLGILMENDKPLGGKYSYDKENRKSIPGKDFNAFLRDNKIAYPESKYDNEYYTKAIKYCEKTFTNHYPDNYCPENVKYHPVTHQDARKKVRLFIKYKLIYFGDYQDAIDDDPFLFHSVISPQLNNGLLTPAWVVKQVLSFFHRQKPKLRKKILPAVEGFIRQLNWREYSRLLYRHAYDQMISNYFGNTRSLDERWYSGTLGIPPVDHAIQTAFQYGYLHHIVRLMVMCNFMNLCHIHPDYAYKWFIEFSLDSYDWVMINNVYSMGFFADGGLTTTKPYISSSNYLKKMTNWKSDNVWDVTWTTLYYYFISTNYDKFTGRAKIYCSQWDKYAEKKMILKKGKQFIEELTRHGVDEP